MVADRTERHALAAQQPERTNEMSAHWDVWAELVGVMHWPLDGGKGNRRK